MYKILKQMFNYCYKYFIIYFNVYNLYVFERTIMDLVLHSGSTKGASSDEGWRAMLVHLYKLKYFTILMFEKVLNN